MWARVVEMMLGVWLLISPFVFHHPADAPFRWAVDLAAGTLVIAFALGSFHRRLPRLHLAHLATVAALLGTGWVVGGPDPAPVHQNWVTVSLLLAMFAVVPSRAHRPPRKWLLFYQEKGGE